MPKGHFVMCDLALLGNVVGHYLKVSPFNGETFLLNNICKMQIDHPSRFLLFRIFYCTGEILISISVGAALVKPI